MLAYGVRTGGVHQWAANLLPTNLEALPNTWLAFTRCVCFEINNEEELDLGRDDDFDARISMRIWSWCWALNDGNSKCLDGLWREK